MLPRPLPRASAVWLGIIGGAGLLDVYCDRGEPDGDTISESVRRLVGWLPGGRVIFTASCVAVPLWFYNHILSGLSDRIEAIGDPRSAPTPGGLANT